MITIRQGRYDDVPKVVTFDKIAKNSAKRRKWLKKIFAQEKALIASNGSVPIGYLVIEYEFYGFGFISMVYVSRKFRRMGIASKLIRNAEKTCRSNKIFTSANHSNSNMRKLLVKTGYKESGIIHNLDVGDPEIIYYKKL